MEQIRIDFEFTTMYGVYRDALYLPADHGLSQEQITAMQQERVNNWMALIASMAETEAS